MSFVAGRAREGMEKTTSAWDGLSGTWESAGGMAARSRDRGRATATRVFRNVPYPPIPLHLSSDGRPTGAHEFAIARIVTLYMRAKTTRVAGEHSVLLQCCFRIICASAFFSHNVVFFFFFCFSPGETYTNKGLSRVYLYIHTIYPRYSVL